MHPLPSPADTDLLPLTLWQPPADLVGVFTDIDDTLTTDGAITPLSLIHI